MTPLSPSAQAVWDAELLAIAAELDGATPTES
jgi:hypothetical protein